MKDTEVEEAWQRGGCEVHSNWRQLSEKCMGEGMLKDTYHFYDFTYGGQGTYNL